MLNTLRHTLYNNSDKKKIHKIYKKKSVIGNLDGNYISKMLKGKNILRFSK